MRLATSVASSEATLPASRRSVRIAPCPADALSRRNSITLQAVRHGAHSHPSDYRRNQPNQPQALNRAVA